MIENYSLTRALKNVEGRDTPEFEEAKQDQSWRIESGIPEPGRSINVSWNRLSSIIHKRDLSTATQSGGAFLVGSDVIGGVRDSLRPTSLLMKLPITVIEGLKGSAVLPRISTGITATSPLTEIGSVSEIDPSFGAAAGGPRRVSGQIYVSRQLLAQSSASAEAYLAREITRAINQQIDIQIINSPQGLLNQSVTSQITYTATNGFVQIMAAQKQLEDGFVDSDSAIWLISTATAKNWRTLLKSTSTAHFILDGDGCVNDIPAYVTSYIPSTSDQTILADWSQLVLGWWGNGIDIIYDPYSRASLGEVVLTGICYFNSWAVRPSTFVVSTNAGSAFTS